MTTQDTTSKAKIFTVCLHAVIDETYPVEDYAIDGTFRCDAAEHHPAGKGVNVAYALAALGQEPECLLLCGENEAGLYEKSMRDQGVVPHIVPVSIPTRRHITVIDPKQNTTTHIQVRGYEHPPEVFKAAWDVFSERVGKDTTVIISGSLPPGAPVSLNAELVRLAQECGARTILDANGAPLTEGIKAKPYALKPNREEAELLAGRPLPTLEDQVQAAREIRESGIQWLALSDGPHGVLWSGPEGAWHGVLPVGSVAPVNVQGCGDSLVAGIADAWQRGLQPDEVLRHAVACAGANLLISGAGLLHLGDVQRLASQVRITPIA